MGGINVHIYVLYPSAPLIVIFELHSHTNIEKKFYSTIEHSDEETFFQMCRF